MARLGAFCFPGTGHINPMTALARRLQQRGHEVVIFGIADIEPAIRAAGIEFHRIGGTDFPSGTLRKLDQQLGQLHGLKALQFTVGRVKNTARMVLRDGPDAVREEHVEALLVDEADMTGSVAEFLGLPFVSVAFFPPLMRDDRIPPFCFGWAGGQGILSRLRNRLGMHLLYRIAAPVLAVINEQRAIWGLRPLAHVTDALSPLAQITQLPEVLEFPLLTRPPLVHYTGPFIDPLQRPKVDFEWERLDGRPLVYASLGTLQNGSERVFRIIADACAGLDLQLILSLGGGIDVERLGPMRGNPVVVRYAPQLEILKRAAAVITHAGLNTALETLLEGVPMVCIPRANDQPGVASRLAARRAAVVVSRHRLTVNRLRSAVQAILKDQQYRRAARDLQCRMQGIDGLERATDIIEDALKVGLSRRLTPAAATFRAEEDWRGAGLPLTTPQ